MKDSIGIIVGRFQVPYPHFGHYKLIEFVASQHKEIIIFIGCSPLKFTKHDPLPFHIRRDMLEDYLREMGLGDKYRILPINDCRQDKIWNEELDRTIERLTHGNKVCLYGGRDSFLKTYIGKYPTCDFPEIGMHSGTQIRKFHGTKQGFWRSDATHRVGIIYATQNQFPIVYSTVDIAVISKDSKILLGRKPGESLWQFIGGFVDPMDQTLQGAAHRELAEETGIIFLHDFFTYIDSIQIDDWRYRGQADKIMTHFFLLRLENNSQSININPNDDIEELAWFPLEDAKIKLIIEHLPLYELLENELCFK